MTWYLYVSLCVFQAGKHGQSVVDQNLPQERGVAEHRLRQWLTLAGPCGVGGDGAVPSQPLEMPLQGLNYLLGFVFRGPVPVCIQGLGPLWELLTV